MRLLLFFFVFFASLSSSASIIKINKVSTDSAHLGPKFTVNWQVVPGTLPPNNRFFEYMGIAAFPCTWECSAVQGWMAPEKLSWSLDFSQGYTPIPWENMADKFVAKYGSSGQTAIYTNTQGSGKGWVVCFAGRVGTLQLYPMPGSCSIITTVPNTCDWTVDSNINHGALTVEQVNGHVAETTGYFKCDDPSSVKVSFLNDSAYLGQNITSKLTINGSNSADVSVNGNASVTLRSTLQTTGAIPGAFSGNAVAIIELQ